MINLSIGIRNPLSSRWSTMVHKHIKKGNKGLETNVYKTNTVVSLDIDISMFTDHSGVRVMVGLFGYDAELHFYDTRHAERRWPFIKE